MSDVADARNALIAAIDSTASILVVNRLYVKYAMALKANNKVHTARALGIDRRTIQRWAKLDGTAAVIPPVNEQ